MSKDHYIAISPDYDYYYQDEEGMCGGSTDDVIENYEWDLQPKFIIIIPGLGNWINHCDYPDVQAPDYESWWLEGWRIAKEIRKRLPSTIDLYYMCFDPTRPDIHPDYNSCLPRIIVPF